MNTLQLEMTRDELTLREQIIADGRMRFIEVGTALMDIRDRKGYRFGYKTFEEYCEKKWGFSRQQGYRLMGAAEVAGILSPTGDISGITERQLRGVSVANVKQAISEVEPVYEHLEESTEAPTKDATRLTPTAQKIVKRAQQLAARVKPKKETPAPVWSQYAYSCRDNEAQQLHDIIRLYLKSDRFGLDPTFSEGKIWQGLPRPTCISDKEPQVDGCQQMDITALTYADESFDSVFVDLPWVLKDSERDGSMGLIESRFNSFKDWPTLEDTFRWGLAEVERVLRHGGVTCWKVGNQISSGKFYPLNVYLINWAWALGFILLNDPIAYRTSAMMAQSYANQKNFRQVHCYYLIFRKP